MDTLEFSFSIMSQSGELFMSDFVILLTLDKAPRVEWVAVVSSSSMGSAYSEAGDRIRRYRQAGLLSGVIDSIRAYPKRRG
jgi:hypothetical protein